MLPYAAMTKVGGEYDLTERIGYAECNVGRFGERVEQCALRVRWVRQHMDDILRLPSIRADAGNRWWCNTHKIKRVTLKVRNNKCIGGGVEKNIGRTV